MFPFLSLLAVSASASDLTILQQANGLRPHRMATTAPIIPQSAYESALRGTPVARIARVDGVAAAKAWGVAVIDEPITLVWMAVNDETAMQDVLPVRDVQFLSGAAGSAPRRVFEFLPLPLLKDRWWVVDVQHNSDLYARSSGRVWEQTWTDATHDLLPSGAAATAAGGIPVAWTTGAWLLVALDDQRTLVEYYVWTDPGGSLPAGPATRFAAGAVQDTLDGLKTVAGRAHSWPTSGFTTPDGHAL